MSTITDSKAVYAADTLFRPAADTLAGLCNYVDSFVNLATNAELLTALGITPEQIAATSLPDSATWPAKAIVDPNNPSDGRPSVTNLHALQLIRIAAQLQAWKNLTQNGIAFYTQTVAQSIALNPRI